MDRKLEGASSILCKTNRQFYIRRKKSPDDATDQQLRKVMKRLVKQNESTSRARLKYEALVTQSRDDSIPYKFNINSSTVKVPDRIFEIAQAKKTLEANLKKINPGFKELFKVFQKCISSESMEQAQFYQMDFYETFNQLASIQIEKIKNSLKTDQSAQRTTNMAENAILIQNIRLEKENQLLLKQISSAGASGLTKEILNTLNDRSHGRLKQPHHFIGLNSILNEEPKDQSIVLQRRLQIKTQQMEIMKREIETSKEETYLLREEKRSLRQRISELKAKNENLCSQIINLQIKNKKIGYSDDRKQAIMAMQYQQIQSFRRQISELRKLYANLNKKYKALIVKFKKSTLQNSDKLGNLISKQIESFPEQLEAFEEVRYKTHNHLKFNALCPPREKKWDKTITYQQFLGAKETLNNKEGIKKIINASLHFLMPTFFSLISEDINYFGIDQNNIEHFNQKIKLDFIGTVRAIMDSKFNQFVWNRDKGQSSSFPAFVLAWLQTFCIDDNKKVVRVEPSSCSTRQAICTFYTNLMSQKLNCSWEIITFRQFLLETFNNEQLYFYLSARNFLIGGDIAEDLSYCFDQIYYVDINKVTILVNKLFKESEVESKKIFQQFLRRSTLYIRKKGFLDIHYVLRILLEHFQGLKQRQIDRILKTIETIQGSKRGPLSLGDFEGVCHIHFRFMAQTQIIDLYRKCYCVGNGNVSEDIVVGLLIQENVFVQWVQTLMSNSPIVIDQIENSQEDVNFVVTPNLEWLYEIQRKYRYLLNSQLRREAHRLGVEELLHKLNKTSSLDAANIFKRLQLALQMCHMLAKKFFHTGVYQNDSLQQVIEPLTAFLGFYSKATLRKGEIRSIIKDSRCQMASARIARFYLKKKAEMTRNLLYSYSSNLERQYQNEKTETVRAEFMNLVEDIKEKKLTLSRKAVSFQQI